VDGGVLALVGQREGEAELALPILHHRLRERNRGRPLRRRRGRAAVIPAGGGEKREGSGGGQRYPAHVAPIIAKGRDRGNPYGRTAGGNRRLYGHEAAG